MSSSGIPSPCFSIAPYCSGTFHSRTVPEASLSRKDSQESFFDDWLQYAEKTNPGDHFTFQHTDEETAEVPVKRPSRIKRVLTLLSLKKKKAESSAPPLSGFSDSSQLYGTMAAQIAPEKKPSRMKRAWNRVLVGLRLKQKPQPLLLDRDWLRQAQGHFLDHILPVSERSLNLASFLSSNHTH